LAATRLRQAGLPDLAGDWAPEDGAVRALMDRVCEAAAALETEHLKWDEGKLCMSRYPDESTRRFDQQFAETTTERNARLRKARLAARSCPPDEASEAQCDAPYHMRNGVPYCEICGRERLSRMEQ